MPLAIPPELKKISPYVRRAEELDRDTTSPESRLVAFYCRQFAVHMGIPLATTPPGKACLGGLLEQLEKEKPAMDNFTRDEAAFICRKFANNIFDKADQEDRNGDANKNTAKTFYAAASFLQILEQFEAEGTEEGGEDRKRILYAKWKATDILKALKEGRTPTPGGYDADEDGPGGEDSEGDNEPAAGTTGQPPVVETVAESDTDDDDGGGQEEAGKDNGAFVLPPASTPMPPPVSPPPPQVEESDEEVEEAGQEVQLDAPPPAYPGGGHTDRPKLSFSLPPPVDETPALPPPAAVKPTVKPPKKTGGGLFGLGKKKSNGGAVSKTQLADATELTRFALSALQEKDADLAAERLQQALSALGR